MGRHVSDRAVKLSALRKHGAPQVISHLTA